MLADANYDLETRPLHANREITLIGRIIGNYRLAEQIGAGGMATVYRGVHTVLGHDAAVKVLHRWHLACPTMLHRFVNEARSVAAIQHPGIVAFHDIGRTDDGRIFTVMELLRGESLHKRLRHGALSEQQVLRIARQIASALAASHELNVIHRDIKPDNIFLVPDPEMLGGERVKVLDFGIAKMMSEQHIDVTGVGMIVGTPAYMAPEQALPNNTIDARADIYSLGVLMYRMITGRRPFSGDSDREILLRHRRAAVVQPSRHGVLISAGLEEIIMTCLEKDPQLRFQSMRVLAERLAELEERASANDMSETMPVPAGYHYLPLSPVSKRMRSRPEAADMDLAVTTRRPKSNPADIDMDLAATTRRPKSNPMGTPAIPRPQSSRPTSNPMGTPAIPRPQSSHSPSIPAIAQQPNPAASSTALCTFTAQTGITHITSTFHSLWLWIVLSAMVASLSMLGMWWLSLR